MLLAARVASALLQAGSLVVLARATAIEDFGSYSIGIAIGAIVTGALAFGIPTRALRLPHEEAERLRFTILTVAICQTFLIGVVLAIALLLLTGGETPTWLLAAAAYTATELFVSVCQNLLFGEQRTRRIPIVMVGRRLLPFALLLCATASSRLDPFIAYSIGCVLAAVLAALCIGLVRRSTLRVRELLRSSKHYWASNVWSMAQQLDVPIIGAYFGAPSAGGYAAGFRLASPVHMVTSLLVSTSVPELTRAASAKSRALLARGTVRRAVMYAALVAACAPATYWLGPLLLGPQFVEFALAFPLLFASSAVSVVNQLMTAVLYSNGIARPVATANLASTATGLAVLLVACLLDLQPLAFGAALVTQLVLLALISPRTRRTLNGEAASDAK